MTFHIAGKNMDIGEALRGHAAERIGGAVEKYFGGGSRTHVVMEREGFGFRAECNIHLDSGLSLKAEAMAEDARLAFDQAADRIEKRLRRYKRRLRDHAAGPRDDGLDATAYVIQGAESAEEEVADDNPVIIAEETTSLRTLTVGGAVMEMDLRDAPVLVFRHAGHGGINVVYRRQDGNIGWIDPGTTDSGKAKSGEAKSGEAKPGKAKS